VSQLRPCHPGEHRAGVVLALRATTAAPWYMEELVVDKELGLGVGACISTLFGST